jgi:hypothetical protein
MGVVRFVSRLNENGGVVNLCAVREGEEGVLDLGVRV